MSRFIAENLGWLPLNTQRNLRRFVPWTFQSSNEGRNSKFEKDFLNFFFYKDENNFFLVSTCFQGEISGFLIFSADFFCWFCWERIKGGGAIWRGALPESPQCWRFFVPPPFLILHPNRPLRNVGCLLTSILLSFHCFHSSSCPLPRPWRFAFLCWDANKPPPPPRSHWL